MARSGMTCVRWFEFSDEHTGITTSSAGEARGWPERLTALTALIAKLCSRLWKITWISA
jgi:hypothetical protein